MTEFDETIPCKTCGKPTRMKGTKLCDNCFEVESRLEKYLKSDKGKIIISEQLPAVYPKYIVLKLSKVIDLGFLYSYIDAYMDDQPEKTDWAWKDLMQVFLDCEKKQ
jgi:hypothetical protein